VARWARASLTVVLTATVLLLLPLLALLQYRWLSQIGEETGSRMRAVAMSAAEAMSADLAFEVGRAWRERVEPSDPATTNGRADTSPLVLDALVVDATSEAQLRVRRWNLDSRTCEPARWPASYGEFPPDPHRLVDMLQRRSTALGAVTIGVSAARGRTPGVRPPCEVSDEAAIVFRLDAALLRGSLVPEVARRHLSALQGDDFNVAIVSGPRQSDVIYSSPGADARAIAARPDVVLPLTLVEGDRFRRGGGGRGRGGREGPPGAIIEGRGRPPGRGQVGEAGDAWLFVAQHQAGSLERAVSRLRVRNLGISLGILSLLGVAVGVIGVSARRAERLGRQQVEFVAAVSHEMRTPVTGIELAARNLEDGLVADPARVQRYGGVIRAEARRLADTVERVLQFAALESGRAVGPAMAVDVRAVVEDVVARARAEQPGVTIGLDVEGDEHYVLGDAAAVRSATQNLVANALKYGGTPPWVRVRLEGTEGEPAELRVTVEDHGPGIDARDVPHVFEPFYRGKLATERRVAGNGLGLHIVKRSVEAMGGRVTLRTERGSGTAITLHIPVPSVLEADDGEPTTPAAGR
jgi:signal transduction histidine kinase